MLNVHLYRHWVYKDMDDPHRCFRAVYLAGFLWMQMKTDGQLPDSAAASATWSQGIMYNDHNLLYTGFHSDGRCWNELLAAQKQCQSKLAN